VKINNMCIRDKSSVQALLIWPALLSVAMLCGCGSDGSDAAIQALNSSNLKRMCSIYNEYQSQHGWAGPKDEEALKLFISELPKSTMELIGADPENVDALFVSERDGEPFKIRYKIRGSYRASDRVIFETVGVDGSRLVGFTGPHEEVVDNDAEYERLWKGKVEQEANSRQTTYGPE